jgi:hypothetical protein
LAEVPATAVSLSRSGEDMLQELLLSSRMPAAFR